MHLLLSLFLHKVYIYMHTHVSVSRQCGILNISQPHRPPRPVTGISLLTSMYCLVYAVDAHPLKMQRIQNQIIRAIGNVDWHTAVREIHMTFIIRSAHDFMQIYAVDAYN
jgi:hypothetical protein